jgi:hypothetical protein
MKDLKSFINENEMQKAAREKIKREKEADKRKHDRMMDAARRRDTVTANQKEEFELDEGTNFAAHRAAQATAPTQADRKKMAKVAALLKRERGLKKEEVQIDEISAQTAKSYIQKAYDSDRNMANKQTTAQRKQDYKTGDAISKKRNLRQKGINRATKKLFGEACWSTHKQEGMKKKGNRMVPNCVPKEEVEQVDEISAQTAKSAWLKRKAQAAKVSGHNHDILAAKARKNKERFGYKEELPEAKSAQDPDIKDREGTQPAAYHKGLKKSTKAKRDAHFKKHGPKPDNDASAYKDAPGDKEARAKGMRKSKYTSFVDKMMDESVMHVNMHHIDGSKHEKGAVDVLKKHEKAGSISFDGETDKGILFKVHKRHHVNTINRELKKHMTSLSEEDKGFAAKAKKSGISVGTLRKVYNRGVAAWKTGHRPGTTPQQWGHARVNAFIAKKKRGGLNHDKDLA